jgi:hypothetical protein
LLALAKMKIEEYKTVSQMSYTDVSKINEGQVGIGICDKDCNNFGLRLNNDISIFPSRVLDILLCLKYTCRKYGDRTV